MNLAEMVEIGVEHLAIQGAGAGIDSVMSKLASVRARVHVGLGSGQDLCIRSGWQVRRRGRLGEDEGLASMRCVDRMGAIGTRTQFAVDCGPSGRTRE